LESVDKIIASVNATKDVDEFRCHQIITKDEDTLNINIDPIESETESLNEEVTVDYNDIPADLKKKPFTQRKC